MHCGQWSGSFRSPWVTGQYQWRFFKSGIFFFKRRIKCCLKSSSEKNCMNEYLCSLHILQSTIINNHILDMFIFFNAEPEAKCNFSTIIYRYCNDIDKRQMVTHEKKQCIDKTDWWQMHFLSNHYLYLFMKVVFSNRK